MNLIIEVITGIFYRPSHVFNRLNQKAVDGRIYFFLAGLPFIAIGAAGRAYGALPETGEESYLWLNRFLIHLVSFTLTFLLGGFLIARLAPAFKAISHTGKALLLVITSYIPFLVAIGLAPFLPQSSLVAFVGLTYTILIFSKGAGILLAIPQPRIIGFTMISFLILFTGNYVANVLFESLFLPHSTM